MAQDETRDALIEQFFGRFAGDLWIKRRLELAEVVDHLKQIISLAEESNQVEEWIKFIKFLDIYCSGRHFINDKQWSELMNHMQISRRLNHRSVKFRDILRNYDLINSNRRQIKRMNESTRLVQIVEDLLAQLDSLILKGSLDMISAGGDHILDQLSSSKHYIRDRCQPLLNTLRVELLNETLRDDSHLEDWKRLADKHECSLRKVDGFLTQLSKFQRKLLQLIHLIGRRDNPYDERPPSSVVSSVIEICKAQYRAAYKFNEELVNSLIKRCSGKGVSFTKIISLDTSHGYSKAMVEACATLDDCDLKLAQLISDLRIEFGRFYFVSDPELLTIIGLDTKLVITQDSSSRQIIGKLFSNSFEHYLLDDATQQLIGVQNSMGEVVYFLDGPIFLKKRVKIYSLEIVRIFNETLRKLSISLKNYLGKCFSLSSMESPPLDAELPVQVIQLRDQINFTTSLEEIANGRGDLISLREFYELKLRELSKGHVETNHAELDRYKSSLVISLTIHFLSILRDLMSTNTKSRARPNLHRQLRHYFDAESFKLEVKIGTSTFEYGYEYLPLSVNSFGNQKGRLYKRLINTRINELSFVVASAAISTFKLGANPYGPAGSGKTETIKALGHLLGYQVVVHNCDETNDSESLDRIISGLAQTGLWGCFDEFNRLSNSTLSAFSARLELVQGAIREGKNTLETEEGQFMRINPNAAFFVTLNPGGDNTRYKGRRKLPANLRHLFIPIAMTQVEVEIIFAEMLMTSNALLRCAKLEIDEARALGGRFGLWMDEMRCIDLGGQRCEWDLRLVMAILKRIERLFVASDLAHYDSDHVDWNSLLQRAIKIEIEPRLTEAESELLNRKLEGALDNSDKKIIEPSNKSKKRHIEFQMETHTGVLLLGPTTSGKSFSWRKLHSERENTTKWLALNPKSCQDLLGNVDPSSDKWSDGLFTALVRRAHGMLLEDQSCITQVWIVLDGPIDPDWIESLNSVLDDNQILTLGSGERLSFVVDGNKCIKLIFEVCDISLASPATISRLGLVQFNNEVFECNSARLSSSSSLKDFFQADDNLCIVVGSSIGVRLCLRESYSSLLKVQEYYCSEYSTSKELQQLMIEKGCDSDVLVFFNVQLIEPDNKYGSRSFIELLRFMLTYHGYYDSEHNFHRLKSKFIITLDSLEQLEDRILSRARVIHHVDPSKTEPASSNYVNSLEEYIRHNILFGGSSNDPVISFSDIPLPMNIQKQLTVIPSTWRVSTFRTRNEIHDSILHLEELVTRPLFPDREESIFVLKDIECNLMSKTDRSKLYHLLNRFKINSRSSKFIYLDYSKRSRLNEFWVSISSVYTLKRTSISGEPLELYLEEKFNSIVKSVTISSRKWLVKKVVSYINSVKYDFNMDKIHIEQLSNCIITFINEAFSNMEQKQRIMSQGLNRLKNFGKTVETMKVKCRLQEKELKNRKCRIEELMAGVNISIETAQNQRDKIELLKEKHMQRTEDIKAKSLDIERDLKQVADMVEDSKVEIEQYLKPEALNEIKSLREAPKTIKDILEVLFLLLGLRDLSWISIKTHLAKGNLRDNLTKYDARKRLNADLLSKVELMMDERKSSFFMENATRASKAVIPIIGWIRATVEYGKMMVKLKPLTNEMDELSHKSADIIKEADELRKELEKLDYKIAHDDKELDELKKKYKESQETLENIKCHLSKAENIAQNLETQRSTWEKKLARVNLILEDEDLTKLCLASSLLVVIPSWTEIEGDLKDNLNHLLSHCELAKQEEDAGISRKAFVERATNLFLPVECLDELVLVDEEEVSAILCLMIVKLCLLINLVPFIDIDDSEEEQAVELRLVKTLSLKQVLCSSSNAIPLCKLSLGNNSSIDDTTTSSSQTVDLNISLGRLMCLKLASNQWNDLEVASIISTTTSKATYGNADNNRLALILAGKLSEHPEIRRLIRAVESPVASYHSCLEIQSMLLDCLVSFYDPQLNQSIRQHEQQLETKQAEVRDLEWRLLDRLAASNRNTETTNDEETTAKWELNGDLVDILIELQQSSRKLAIDVSQLSVRLDELKRKQTEYLEVALKAEKFYSDFLQELGNNDAFYSLPLEKYCSLILKSLVGSESKRQLNYSYLASRVARGMRSHDSQVFFGCLREKQIVDHDFDTQHSGILKDSLLETIQTIQNGQHGGVQLMVLVHDSSNSSPQLELDEIVQNYNREAQVGLKYNKIYAISGKTGRDRIKQAIETAIKTSNLKARANREEVECVCIGNAQLVDWSLDTWLLEILKTPLDDCKVLILLITEASGVDENLTTSNSVHGIDASLLGLAHVKVWYDESGLSLPARFKLLTDRLVLDLQTPTTGGSMLDQSIRRLVLLHVVCQERSRRSKELSATDNLNKDDELHCCWLKSYVFDYNQLRLASKCLHSLLVSNGKPDWEVVFCHHLRDIIYGPRLETGEDQHQLALLVGKFIEASDPPTPDQIVDHLDTLLLGKEQDLAQYEKCLSNLVSTGTSWKQADWCNN